MLREMLRSKREPRSKTLVKVEDLNNINILSENSTLPGTIALNTIGTHSGVKEIKESSNGSLSIKQTLNSNINTNNNNIIESNPISSSHSVKAKTNSIQSNSNTIHSHTHNQLNSNAEDTINNNVTHQIDSSYTNPNANIIHNKTTNTLLQTQTQPQSNSEKSKQLFIKTNNQAIDYKYEEPVGEYLNTTPTPKNPSKLLSSKSNSNSTNKLQTLESFITQIKQNVYEKSKPYLTQKERTKNNLKTNVEVLSSNIRSVHRENKVNGQLNKTIVKENDRLISAGERASRETFYMNKELPFIRIEIDEMKTTISQYTEETKYIRNDAIQLERETMLLKDEIKKTNCLISQISKQNESLTKAKVPSENHIEMAKEKLQKQERLIDELLTSVKLLLDQSSHVFDHVSL